MKTIISSLGPAPPMRVKPSEEKNIFFLCMHVLTKLMTLEANVSLSASTIQNVARKENHPETIPPSILSEFERPSIEAHTFLSFVFPQHVISLLKYNYLPFVVYEFMSLFLPCKI